MTAPTEMKTPFERLSKVNVNNHIEKKNGLSYLSWAWAWAELMKADHTATVEYHAPTEFGNKTFMVSCTVTAFGIPRTMSLPVMDHRNKAISDPDAFAFNTAMQRCMVKAIALHGLGLYIYAGEDLPEESKADIEAQQQAEESELLIKYQEAALKGTEALLETHKALYKAEKSAQSLWKKHGESLKHAAKKADEVTT